MNIYALSALAVGMLVVGVVAAKTTSSGSLSDHPFLSTCRDSLSEAAAWTAQEGERQGKNVSVTQRAVVALKIPSVCKCTYEALGSTIPSAQNAIAGKLTGVQYKLTLALSAKDRVARDNARNSSRQALEDLSSTEGVSLAEIGLLSRHVDAALKRCFHQHFAKR